jgi:predicted metal-binding membrane protein
MENPQLTHAVPIAVGAVILMAGSLQLTAWKAHHLGCCRETPGHGRTLPADAGAIVVGAGLFLIVRAAGLG